MNFKAVAHQERVNGLNKYPERGSNIDLYTPVENPDQKGLNLDRDKLHRIKNAIRILQKEHERFLRSKLVLESVEECIENEDLPVEVCEKITSIIHFPHSQISTSFCAGDCDNIDILGLSSELEEDENRLTLSENTALRLKTDKKLMCSSSQTEKFRESLENDGLLHYIEHIIGSETLFSDNQVEMYKKHTELFQKIEHRVCLLNNIDCLQQQVLSFQLNTLHNDNLCRVKTLAETAKELEYKARIFQLKAESILLSSNVNTIEALSLMREMVNKEEEDLTLSLKRLKVKLNTYKELDSTEFPDIVQQYIKTKKLIIHWKWTRDEIMQTNKL